MSEYASRSAGKDFDQMSTNGSVSSDPVKRKLVHSTSPLKTTAGAKAPGTPSVPSKQPTAPSSVAKPLSTSSIKPVADTPSKAPLRPVLFPTKSPGTKLTPDNDTASLVSGDIAGKNDENRRPAVASPVRRTPALKEQVAQVGTEPASTIEIGALAGPTSTSAKRPTLVSRTSTGSHTSQLPPTQAPPLQAAKLDTTTIPEEAVSCSRSQSPNKRATSPVKVSSTAVATKPRSRRSTKSSITAPPKLDPPKPDDARETATDAGAATNVDAKNVPGSVPTSPPIKIRTPKKLLKSLTSPGRPSQNVEEPSQEDRVSLGSLESVAKEGVGRLVQQGDVSGIEARTHGTFRRRDTATDKSKEEVEQLRAEHAVQLEKLAREHTEALASLQKQLDANKGDIAKVPTLELEISALQRSLEESQTKAQSTSKQHEQAIRQREADNQELAHVIGELQAEILRVEVQLNEDNKRKQQEAKEANARNKELQAEMKALRSALAKEKQRYAAVVEEKQRYAAVVEDLQNQVIKLQHHSADNSGNAEAYAFERLKITGDHDVIVDNLKTTHSEAQRQKRNELLEAQQENQRLRNELQGLKQSHEKETERLKAESKCMSQVIATLQTDVANSQQSSLDLLLQKERESTATNQIIEDLQNEIKDLLQRITDSENLQRETEEAQSNEIIDGLRVEVESLRLTIEELQTDADDHRNAVRKKEKDISYWKASSDEKAELLRATQEEISQVREAIELASAERHESERVHEMALAQARSELAAHRTELAKIGRDHAFEMGTLTDSLEEAQRRLYDDIQGKHDALVSEMSSKYESQQEALESLRVELEASKAACKELQNKLTEATRVAGESTACAEQRNGEAASTNGGASDELRDKYNAKVEESMSRDKEQEAVVQALQQSLADASRSLEAELQKRAKLELDIVRQQQTTQNPHTSAPAATVDGEQSSSDVQEEATSEGAELKARLEELQKEKQELILALRRELAAHDDDARAQNQRIATLETEKASIQQAANDARARLEQRQSEDSAVREAEMFLRNELEQTHAKLRAATTDLEQLRTSNIITEMAVRARSGSRRTTPERRDSQNNGHKHSQSMDSVSSRLTRWDGIFNGHKPRKHHSRERSADLKEADTRGSEDGHASFHGGQTTLEGTMASIQMQCKMLEELNEDFLKESHRAVELAQSNGRLG